MNLNKIDLYLYAAWLSIIGMSQLYHLEKKSIFLIYIIYIMPLGDKIRYQFRMMFYGR